MHLMEQTQTQADAAQLAAAAAKSAQAQSQLQATIDKAVLVGLWCGMVWSDERT